MKKFGGCLFFILLTMGCAQQITPAVQEQNNAQIFNAAINQAAQRATLCLEEMTQNPSVQYVYANILFEKPTSPNKIELLASTAKLADSQKKYLIEFYSLLQACRPQITAGLSDYPSIISTFNRGFGDSDILFADLLAKRITIGEANTEKVKLVGKTIEDTTNAVAAIRIGYNAQYNQDMNRQEAEDNSKRAIASGYLLHILY